MKYVFISLYIFIRNMYNYLRPKIKRRSWMTLTSWRHCLQPCIQSTFIIYRFYWNNLLKSRERRAIKTNNISIHFHWFSCRWRERQTKRWIQLFCPRRSSENQPTEKQNTGNNHFTSQWHKLPLKNVPRAAVSSCELIWTYCTTNWKC